MRGSVRTKLHTFLAEEDGFQLVHVAWHDQEDRDLYYHVAITFAEAAELAESLAKLVLEAERLKKAAGDTAPGPSQRLQTSTR